MYVYTFLSYAIAISALSDRAGFRKTTMEPRNARNVLEYTDSS